MHSVRQAKPISLQTHTMGGGGGGGGGGCQGLLPHTAALAVYISFNSSIHVSIYYQECTYICLIEVKVVMLIAHPVHTTASNFMYQHNSRWHCVPTKNSLLCVYTLCAPSCHADKCPPPKTAPQTVFSKECFP